MFSLHISKPFAFQLKKLSAAVAMAMLFSHAGAAGWGDITVRSSLGQPLRAEIELVSASRQDDAALSVRLAGQDAYRRANIEFNPVLMSLRFAIEQRGDKHFVRVTSTQPVNEPFVDMLLELNSGTGRMVREYVFLLDPAGDHGAQAAVAAPADDAAMQQPEASSSARAANAATQAPARQSIVKNTNTANTTNAKPASSASNASIKSLEQKVTELQDSLDVTTRRIAELQKQNEAAKDNAAPSPPTATVAAPVVTPAPIADAKPAQAEPKPVAPPKEETNYLIPGAGLLLALLGAAGVYSARRRKAQKPFDTSHDADAQRDKPTTAMPGDATTTTAITTFATSILHPAGHTHLHEVDPLAEADVYIAYGRDVQAEDILKDALSMHPDRHPVRVKLLSIYAGRKDVQSFDALARELHGMTKGEGENWEQAAELGREIDPANPIYAVKTVQPAATRPDEEKHEALPPIPTVAEEVQENGPGPIDFPTLLEPAAEAQHVSSVPELPVAEGVPERPSTIPEKSGTAHKPAT